nr:MAG TPA: hypothetical protein [Caudoviricetes sp.]
MPRTGCFLLLSPASPLSLKFTEAITFERQIPRHCCTASQRIQRSGRIPQAARAAGILPQQQLAEQRYTRQRRYPAAAQPDALHERTDCHECHQHQPHKGGRHWPEPESNH